MSMNAAIIIPSRYGSTRFEGKPLAKLASVEMVRHVYARALMAAHDIRQNHKDVSINVVVATDDDRIQDFCDAHNMTVVMTSQECRTGSDRVLEAAEKMDVTPDIILNLQGDNPFSDSRAMSVVLQDLIENLKHQVATPVARLSWDDLDVLRDHKKTTPYSGTTAVLDEQQKCRWFSKNIIPAVRKEAALRVQSDLSPVNQHIGLYGYRYDALKRFVSLPEGQYEALEGLEQLRFLENDIEIYGCPVPASSMPPVSGIDSPEDLQRAEILIKEGRLIVPDFDQVFGVAQ
jgi:3-deoxy-manno-octulosonate cytidylyltransferase (CMP-KDO synthetase)